jgi:hypothetical protein
MSAITGGLILIFAGVASSGLISGYIEKRKWIHKYNEVNWDFDFEEESPMEFDKDYIDKIVKINPINT